MTGTILIVDDIATSRIVLKVKLSVACYETLQAADGATALAVARRALPDLILLDVMLPDLSGIEVCRRLKADPATAGIPVVMVTASQSAAARMEALRAGADDFLSKPIDETMLMARIRSLLRARETEYELRLRADTFQALGFGDAPAEFEAPGRIGLITGDQARAVVWRSALAAHMRDRIEVLSPAEALSDTRGSGAPDLYMVAADLGAQGSALRLGLQIKRKRRAERLRQVVQNGLEMALTDPLTGLHNRRYALSRLKRIAARSHETGSSFAVMLLDLDRFKAINDAYGHAAGDAVLQAVARRFRACLRPADLLARVGGEEFLVAMPECTQENARVVAERLRDVIGSEPVALPAGGAVTVTVSVGLTMGSVGPRAEVLPAPGACSFSRLEPELPGAMAQAALAKADAALLAAKTEGRNQVNVSASAA